jgi:hypothetical protein
MTKLSLAYLFLAACGGATAAVSQKPADPSTSCDPTEIVRGGASSAENGDIAGMVVNEAGCAPLAGVEVAVKGPTAQSQKTDEKGRFVLAGLPPGTYDATIAKVHRNGIVVSAGQVTILNASLKQ